MRKPSDTSIEHKRVVNLLQMAKRPLTLDQLVVGYFRLYGVARTKKQMADRLFQSSIHGSERIVKTPAGTYTFADDKVVRENYRLKKQLNVAIETLGVYANMEQWGSESKNIAIETLKQIKEL